MFFRELSQIITEGAGLNITVRSAGGKLTVSLFPKVNGLKDEAQNHLQPIVLTGNADELDEGFFTAVGQPIQKATGMLSGMKSFEESIVRVEAEKKEAQEQKRTVDKKAQERKTKYDDFMTRAEHQEKEGKNDNALYLLREARKIADDANIAKTDERIEQLKGKTLQKALF
ncbi:MAG: PRTRC system protein E [Tannerella sp.]|jgi:PRTRC genetic system protein E|nr:PRTRC system protein E [Tannerella sp.]